MAVYKEGAFPFNWFSTSYLVYESATPLGTGKAAVQVTAAVAQDSTTVRVSFSEEMKLVDPGNSDDALNPSNYVFTVTGGVGITASSVSVHQASPTIVDVTTSEMTDGADYNVQVVNAESVGDAPVDPAYDDQDFTGIGVDPTVSSATPQDEQTVRVQFSEPMKADTELTKASNYVFSGPTSLSADTVSVVTSSSVDISLTTEMRDGGAYNVAVSNVRDAAENPLGTPDDADFTGLGVHPELGSASSAGPYEVVVVFSEAVKTVQATNPSNYDIEHELGSHMTIDSVSQYGDDWTYKIETTDEQLSGEYTVTATAIEDLAGNAVEPPNNTATFEGLPYTPPLLTLYPEDETEDVSPRTWVRAHAVDIEENFAGIDVTTWWLTVSYEDELGNTVTRDALLDGVIQAGFEGYFDGDALSTDGITLYIRPMEHYWLPDTEITIRSYVRDLQAIEVESIRQVSFRTGPAVCFEDSVPSPVSMETTIVAGFPNYPKTDLLRSRLMLHCTNSKVLQVQARTVMYLGAVSDLRPILAFNDVFNFSWVDNIRLCDRKNIISIYNDMRKYRQTLYDALSELPFSPAALTLLKTYVTSSSPIHVVNATAAIVVLGAILES